MREVIKFQELRPAGALSRSAAAQGRHGETSRGGAVGNYCTTHCYRLIITSDLYWGEANNMPASAVLPRAAIHLAPPPFPIPTSQPS